MPPYKNYFYNVEGFPDTYPLQLLDTEEVEGIEGVAEEAGSDFEINGEGWEADWPLTFIIYDEKRSVLGKFSIDRICIPEFIVTDLNKEVVKERYASS